MKPFAIAVLLTTSIASIQPAPAHAQGSGHDMHGSHREAGHDMRAEQLLPTEPGQSAFAAIAEIAAMLAADPETDWNRVDIDALRTHLVDMSVLTLDAEVETVEADGQIEFIVSGTGRTREAIQRMVPAHAGLLGTETGWNALAKVNGSGAILTLRAAQPELTRIRGLGFFGVMATGAHHQAHHLAIARGEMIH